MEGESQELFGEEEEEEEVSRSKKGAGGAAEEGRGDREMEWWCLSLTEPRLPAAPSTVMARQKWLPSPLFTRWSHASPPRLCP